MAIFLLEIFSYQANGFISGIVYDINDPTRKSDHIFEYDELGRLTLHEIDSTTVASYAYRDSSGDLATMQGADVPAGTYSYDYHPPGSPLRLRGSNAPTSRTSTGGNTETYNYDAVGRLTAWNDVGGAQRVFTYDGLSRVREVYVNGMLVHEYRYDFGGKRIEVDLPTTASDRIRTFQNWREEPAQPGSSLPSNIIETINDLLAVNVSDSTDHKRRWKLTELQGNVGKYYGDNPINHSDELGSTIFSMTGQSVSEIGTPWHRQAFHGAEDYPANGVDILPMGIRSLSKKDGQWLQPEPLLFMGIPKEKLFSPQGLAAYAYARRNPVMNKDIDGFAPIKIEIEPHDGFTLNSTSKHITETLKETKIRLRQANHQLNAVRSEVDSITEKLAAGTETKADMKRYKQLVKKG